VKGWLTYSSNSFRKFFFLLLFAFPVLPIKATNIIFMLYALFVLQQMIKEKPGFQFRSFMPYAFLSVLFIPYFVEWLLYPSNTIIQFETEKKLLFCIAPFIFYADSRLKTQVDKVLAPLVFIVTVSLLSITSLIYLLSTGLLFSGGGSDQAFQLRSAFEVFSRLHPSYYGLFSSTASLWLMTMYKNCSKPQRIAALIILIPMILLNGLIASKMALLILIVGSVWLVYQGAKDKITKVVLISSIISVISLMTLFIPSLQTRFLEFYTFFNYSSSQNTLVERLVIFNCSKSIFLTDFITGIGSRNTQALLDYCYTWVAYPKGALIHLNSHNQFFTFGINYGIILLVAFLTLFVFYFQKSRSSFLAKIFWLSSFFIMLSESILERQMGIYYFLFFALLFLSVSAKKAPQSNKL